MSDSNAKKYVVEKIYGSDKSYYSLSYPDLFDSRKSTIYFKNLITLIKGKWDFFKDYWSNQEMLLQAFNLINDEGRFDCHASIPTKEEMDILFSAISLVRKGIDKYNSEME